MTKMVISENLKEDLRNYLKNVQGTELVSTYLDQIEFGVYV